MPNMVSLIISAFMWTFIFTIVLPELSKYGLSILNQGWLGDADVAFYSIIIVSLWRGIGYMMIIYIAALRSEERRVGKECRSRWWTEDYKKTIRRGSVIV